MLVPVSIGILRVASVFKVEVTVTVNVAATEVAVVSGPTNIGE